MSNSIFSNNKFKAVFFTVLIVSIIGLSSISKSYNPTPIKFIDTDLDLSCTVEPGPNNGTDLGWTYQYDCDPQEIVLHETRFPSETELKIEWNYTKKVISNSSSTSYGALNLYAVPKYRFDEGVYTGRDLVEIESYETEKMHNSTRNLQTSARYVFFVFTPNSEIDPYFNPVRIDFGMSIEYNLSIQITSLGAPFYNTFRPYILGYFLLLIVSPKLIDFIRNKGWENLRRNHDPDEVKRHHEEELERKKKSKDYYKFVR